MTDTTNMDAIGYVDRSQCDNLEIRIERSAEGARVWVHIDGELVLRAYRVSDVVIDGAGLLKMPGHL